MRQKILNHTSILVVLSVILTFIAASVVMYNKLYDQMKQEVQDETQYIRIGLERFGDSYLSEEMGDATQSRVTLVDEAGNVLFDSEADVDKMENHSSRPEFVEAKINGQGELVRFSETFSRKNYYYAVRLENGKILRVSKSMESIFLTMLSSFTLMGVLMLVILAVEFFLVQKQTKEMIAPINELDLEHPLKNVCYEELRPLLVRVDQQNHQIAKQLEDLKAADAMRRDFSANVSHELKTPLMSISGYAELMMNGMVPKEKIPEFSGRIYHESARLSDLVADIIQLSRMEGNKSDMPFEAVDLNELAQDIVTNLRGAAEKKSIHLELQGNQEFVRGVRQILYEVLYNVADNAIKYTPEGGKVEVTVGKKENHPFYRVQDNGIGIPKKEQSRVFERFYRVDKSHSRQTGGTGLGLSIVKHGAALHHADVHLESEPGKGTSIEIIF